MNFHKDDGKHQGTKIATWSLEIIKEGKTMEILERISQTEWEATPESVKQLVKKLIGTLEVMVPKWQLFLSFTKKVLDTEKRY